MALGHAVAYPVDSRLLEIARHKIVYTPSAAEPRCARALPTQVRRLKRKPGVMPKPSSFNANRCEGTFTILSPHFTLLAGTHSAFRGETNQPIVF